MKRFLLILSCLVLCLSVFTVVAFGAEQFEIVLNEANYQNQTDVTDPTIYNGWYAISITNQYTSDSYSFDPIEISFNSDGDTDTTEALNIDGVYTGQFNYSYRDGEIVWSFPVLPYDPYEAITNVTFVPTEPIPEPTDNDVLGSITSVFGLIGSWVAFALSNFVAIFWTGSELTFIGVLAVCGLAIAVILLICYILSRFIRFKG